MKHTRLEKDPSEPPKSIVGTNYIKMPLLTMLLYLTVRYFFIGFIGSFFNCLTRHCMLHFYFFITYQPLFVFIISLGSARTYNPDAIGMQLVYYIDWIQLIAASKPNAKTNFSYVESRFKGFY